MLFQGELGAPWWTPANPYVTLSQVGSWTGEGKVPSTSPTRSTGWEELELALPTGQPPTRDSLQRLHRLLVVPRAEMLDVARPPREPCTIWTAVAPDPVRTVRSARALSDQRD